MMRIPIVTDRLRAVLPDPMQHYVTTHLTGAEGATRLLDDLVDRIDDPELAEVAAEVQEERSMLLAAAQATGMSPSVTLRGASVVLEQLSRPARGLLAVHGEEMHDFAELESLILGVTGKRALWVMMKDLGHPIADHLPLDRLIPQAEAQIDVLDRIRRRVGRQALNGGGDSPRKSTSDDG